jgi:hypothetical protein
MMPEKFAQNSEPRPLDAVLLRLSALLEEMTQACHGLDQITLNAHDRESVMQAQAVDRLRQQLAACGQFTSALSEIGAVSGIMVGDDSFGAVHLQSMRDALRGQTGRAAPEPTDAIDLFENI